ncbi:iron-sulfur cluster biosynthesis family protein [Cohnella sp. AR92]|uniref:iron-sulfur cluster biosynthesis family protein n=1 Tax=Cohnella sp. AR92 TaxID=648716 RepID=UPI0013156518|nr:iron-sulfur cluster biosynthesis family protein [Cohnella sp. AR92]
MIIEWSEAAVAALRARTGDSNSVWKLVSDSEGCGCAMNGVPALWQVDAPEKDDLQAVSVPIPLWYEPRHAIFFEERMRITYDERLRAFALASDGQIYTNRLAVRDRRNATTSL